MYILGIESSCDDTSVALIDITDTNIKVLAEKTASQIDIHKQYGGVVPEIAGRHHAEAIIPVIEEVMKGQPKPHAIAVTAGPGLVTGLLVGIEAAKTLSYLWDIPLIRTNHIEGHIYSVLLQDTMPNLVFPALCLIVSGGHSELILMKHHGHYTKLGGTRDDAAGECFDKVAKLLQFDYPGGPQISKKATQGNPTAISLPRPMKDSGTYDMSFAGLKTAVRYWIEKQPAPMDDITINNLCASVEQAIVDVLVHKTTQAINEYQPKTLLLAGGVSANTKLRDTLRNATNIPLLKPQPKYCMDNAAMIAVAAYYHEKQGDTTPWDSIMVDPNWRVYDMQTPSPLTK